MAYPEVNPTFNQPMRFISAITNGFPASVTTTQNHLYTTKATIRIDIPRYFGMQQINQQFGEIIVTSPTTFTIDIDTTSYDPFFIPSTYPANAQQAQAVPFAENNSTLVAAIQNTLPH